MLDRRLRQQLRACLSAAVGDRLTDVFLYGSEARGDALQDSDVDLMVVLRGPIDLARDIDMLVRAIYPLQLQMDRPIHVLPVSSDAFEADQFAVYRSVRREGVAL